MANPIKEMTKQLLGRALKDYWERSGLKTLDNYDTNQEAILDGMHNQLDSQYIQESEIMTTMEGVIEDNMNVGRDIEQNILTYMMDVDLMIMEKEENLSNKRELEGEDMATMQERTQVMLEKLIKGQSLTADECRRRIALYLSAKRITVEQAEELEVLVSEIYGE